MAEDTRKAHLSAQLAQARSRIGVNAIALRTEFDLFRRFKQAFARHLATYLGGAGLLGLILSRLAAPPKKIVVERPGKRRQVEEKAVKTGLLLTGVKFAFDMLRPALTKWVTRQVADYASGKVGSRRV